MDSMSSTEPATSIPNSTLPISTEIETISIPETITESSTTFVTPSEELPELPHDNNDPNLILAAIAASSSSSLPLQGKEEFDPNSPSFMLLASLRSQITDLTSQVTNLNSKLVKSYDRIGDLEDDLHNNNSRQVRMKSTVEALTIEKETWEAQIEGGGWVERNHVQGEMQRLMSKVLEETKSRETADLARTSLETEVESLTASLFTEANKMVAVERISRARAEEKMRALEETSSDMAGILDGLQGTLREKVELIEEQEKETLELKRKLGITVEGDFENGAGTLFSDGEKIISSDYPGSPRINGNIIPSHLSLLAKPHLITTTPPYLEFLGFITYLRRLRISVLSPPLEIVGNSVGSRGFGSFSAVPTSSYTSRETGSPSYQTPTQLLSAHLPLSSHLTQPFLKRCLEEDADPTLRLDLAPGLGFLSRRTVGTAIIDGTLLIEPTSSFSSLPSATCCLCGVALEKWWGSEIIVAGTVKNGSTMRKVLGGSNWSLSSFTGTSKRNESVSSISSVSSSSPTAMPTTSTEPAFAFPTPPNQLIHLFKISDTATTSYAICPNYCLPRLRAVCEFWTYVRVMERGLLLEEGFRFVGGGEGGGGNLGGSTSSLNINIAKSEGGKEKEIEVEKEVDVPATTEEPEAATGDNIATEVIDAEVEKDITEEPLVEKLEIDSVSASAPLASQSEATPVTESSSPVESTPSTPLESLAAISTETTMEPESEAEPTPTDVTNIYHPISTPSTATTPTLASSSTFKPPVPKRSTARTGSPSLDITRKDSIEENGIPIKPPRHPLRHGLAKSVIGSFPSPSDPSLDTSVDQHTLGQADSGGVIGWEDRCWSEVIKLKESCFWSRVSASDLNGESILAREGSVV